MNFKTVVLTGEKIKQFFELSGSKDQYNLKEEIKSWLVKNDIKVFIGYDKSVFEIEFQDRSDADFFVKTWHVNDKLVDTARKIS